ncbi:hypothetical protein N3K66_003481 [Trichothecium roseum]|uniref:Uncharacterized protein n=1 Tax=Trichothecium roseum TaxID=47278 RepID=A0ACC0V737_9HYPO|nr:hypothetical protein N3K66_003481 [Trichothecium roseum]
MRAATLFSAAGLAGSAMAAPVLGNLGGAGDVVGQVNQLTVPIVDLLAKVETVTDGVGAGNVVTTIKTALKGVTAKLPVAGGVADVVLGEDGLPVDTLTETAQGILGGVPIAGDLVKNLPLGTVGKLVGGITDKVPVVNDVVRRDAGLENVAGLINLLKGLSSSVKEHTTVITHTITLVKQGKVTKEEAQSTVLPEVTKIQAKLTALVTEITGAAGLPIGAGQVDTVLELVVGIVEELLTTVKAIVAELGLTVQLTSLLRTVFSILATLLTLVSGLLADILPSLVAALNPLLAGVGNAGLAPVLTPLSGLLAGLQLPIA